MKELGIKEGKWIARANDYGVDVIEEQSGFGIIWFGTESELRDCEYPIELAEAHAILCADAGNTAQKCGLLPSELLQQRDELKEALEQIREIGRKHTGPFNTASEITMYEIARIMLNSMTNGK